MTVLGVELVEALRQAGGGPIRVIDPQTNVEYVVLPAAAYDRVRPMLDDDFPSEAVFEAQIESAAAAGWDDPALDIYNDLDPRKP
jgi:hypothetical protein